MQTHTRFFEQFAETLYEHFVAYSCEKYDGATFFASLKTRVRAISELILSVFIYHLKIAKKTDGLFNYYCIVPEFFRNSFPGFSAHEDPFKWQMRPEELFIMLQDCWFTV